MRTTLDIDDDVLQAARERARGERTTVGQVVSEHLRQALTTAPTPAVVRESPAVYRVRLFPTRGAIITNDLINDGGRNAYIPERPIARLSDLRHRSRPDETGASQQTQRHQLGGTAQHTHPRTVSPSIEDSHCGTLPRRRGRRTTLCIPTRLRGRASRGNGGARHEVRSLPQNYLDRSP